MGQVGNTIFIIISGYFLAHKESIDLTKISTKLLLQLGFAAIALGLMSIFVYLNKVQFFTELISFNTFNWMSWYVGYYFVVIVIAKIFLNGFLRRLEKAGYVMFVIVMFALVQFSWSSMLISNFGNGLEKVCTGVFLYSLGGYIRKYNPFRVIKLWGVAAIIVFMNIIVIGNFCISFANSILEYNQSPENMFTQSIPTYTTNQIIPIIIGIATFELFRRMKISNNRVVNFIGASTFMVYLIHDNVLFYKLWNSLDWMQLLHENVILFFGAYITQTSVTFAAGFLCYCVFVISGKIFDYCKTLVIKQRSSVD